MTDADAILVRVLAASDAYLLAVRNWSGPAAANRHQGLQSLAFKGTPFRMNATDEAGRKSGERELVALARKGLLTLRRDRTKFPHVALTPTGDARARALGDLPGRDVGLLILAAVAAKTLRDPRTLDEFWLAEIALNGGRGWGESTAEDRRGLARTESDYLAAAVPGWLVAHSSCLGHCYYAVTSAGWAELDSPSAPPAVGRLPKCDPAASRLYRLEQDRVLVAINNDPPADAKEIGRLPLPVSMAGCPVMHDHDWRRGLASGFAGDEGPEQDDDGDDPPTEADDTGEGATL